MHACHVVQSLLVNAGIRVVDPAPAHILSGKHGHTLLLCEKKTQHVRHAGAVVKAVQAQDMADTQTASH